MTGQTLSALVLAGGVFLSTAAAAGQSTWFVDDDNCPGPGSGTKADPFCSIQHGIDAASVGDEIVVGPGAYHESISFSGKAVTVRSAGGREVTTIDGSGLGISVVTFGGPVGPNTALEGFTITGGDAFAGGGMLNENGSPTVTDCWFAGNTATLFGGGIYSYGGRPTLTGCSFEGNTADGGGGLFTESSNAVMTNCTFRANVATFGGAIFNSGSDPTLTNCTFCENTATSNGGAMINGFGSVTLVNCILWNNGPDEIFDEEGSTTTVLYSDVQGGWTGDGWGNLDADPEFVDQPGGDLRLRTGSPCIDAGVNWGVPIDAGDDDGDGDTAELFPVDGVGNPRFAADEVDFDPGCGVPVVVDMGALEYEGDPVEVIFADIDADGRVRLADLLALLAAWGPCGPACCLADFDIDGNVGISDLLSLLVHWRP
ncbi:MAG: right-handed parallel beta-helix repeat-containing protein [Planctomycetota bacterium]|jgi:predicted outer membrane repeat protein